MWNLYFFNLFTFLQESFEYFEEKFYKWNLQEIPNPDFITKKSVYTHLYYKKIKKLPRLTIHNLSRKTGLGFS